MGQVRKDIMKERKKRNQLSVSSDDANPTSFGHLGNIFQKDRSRALSSSSAMIFAVVKKNRTHGTRFLVVFVLTLSLSIQSHGLRVFTCPPFERTVPDHPAPQVRWLRMQHYDIKRFFICPILKRPWAVPHP
jgi:hypothetical protein